MTTSTNLLPNNEQRRSYLTTLAVVPNTREVGIAVLDLGGLIHHAVVSIRKHPTPEGREAAFRHAINFTLRRFPAICRVAVCVPNRYQTDIPLLDAERHWLSQESTKRCLTFSEYDLDAARRWCAGDRTKPTNRDLAPLLAEEFPELRHALPGPNDLLQRYRFKYWAKVFSAVALAKYDLERTVSGN